jgi:hypothetical protein
VVFHQIGEHLECLGPERDLFSASLQKSTFQVQGEIGETILTVRPFNRRWVGATHTMNPAGLMKSSSIYHRGITTSTGCQC